MGSRLTKGSADARSPSSLQRRSTGIPRPGPTFWLRENRTPPAAGGEQEDEEEEEDEDEEEDEEEEDETCTRKCCNSD
jgi:hypothetical protein